MDAELTRQLIKLVERAGDAILEIYETDFSVNIKADDSPLTQADLAAHKIIAAELARLTPEIPILSEESSLPSFEERKRWSRYWLVDPLDGTSFFRLSTRCLFYIDVSEPDPSGGCRGSLPAVPRRPLRLLATCFW